MSDPDSYKPHRPPTPPRQPQPGETLFEFYRERDHSRWLCELRDHGEPYGVEAQFYQNEEFLRGRRFDRTMSRTQTPRELAVQWAEEEWKRSRGRERVYLPISRVIVGDAANTRRQQARRKAAPK